MERIVGDWGNTYLRLRQGSVWKVYNSSIKERERTWMRVQNNLLWTYMYCNSTILYSCQLIFIKHILLFLKKLYTCSVACVRFAKNSGNPDPTDRQHIFSPPKRHVWTEILIYLAALEISYPIFHISLTFPGDNMKSSEIMRNGQDMQKPTLNK